MCFEDIIKNCKNNTNYVNILEYSNVKIMYFSNIQNLSEIKKYNINIIDNNKKNECYYNVWYLQEEAVYNEILNLLYGKIYKRLQVHTLTRYKCYNEANLNIYLSDNNNQEYVVIKKKNNIFIISKQNDKAQYLLYVIREIIRIISENNKSIMFHAACIEIREKDILIIGDSGSGKTTLLFQLLNKSNSTFISNDRTLIDINLKPLSFPIKIRVSLETIKNIYALEKYIELENITKILDGKTILYPLDIGNWKKQCKGMNNRIKKIIIPNIKLDIISNNMKKIDKETAKIIIARNCYTPIDPEWKIKWFKEDYLFSNDEIVNFKKEIINKMISEIPIYQLNYNGILDNKILKKIMED